MIKARLKHEDHGETIFLGLSEENIKRLKKNQPILIEKEQLNLPFNILISYGQTEESILEDLNIKISKGKWGQNAWIFKPNSTI